MAISVVQTPSPTYVAYTGTTKTYTALTALTVGDYVVVSANNQQDRTFSSVTLGGQAMTAFPNNPINNSFEDHGLWYRRVDGTETGQDVVVTLSGTDGNPSPCGAVVIRGLATTQPTAAGGVESSPPNTIHNISLTPGSADNIFIVFGFGAGRTWTDNGGWTDIGTPPNNASLFAYDITASASARTYEITTGDSAGAMLFAIGSLDGAAGNPWHAYAQMQHPGVQ